MGATVLHPSLEPAERDSPTKPTSRSDQALFVGAFDRPENADAAEWLLRSIWPIVLQHRPTAHLTLAGKGPTERMGVLAGSMPSVEITDYVEDLAPYYNRAAVALVPLRLGAGVKFKVITAMFWGIPVVATSVGAEGVSDEVRFSAVVDDPEGFAAAAVAVLTDRSAFARRTSTSLDFVLATYGDARFEAELDALYRRFASEARA